jgi:uncharacterized RDD family membrane protein YckC
MARWRDIKQGKVDNSIKQKKSKTKDTILSNCCNTPLINRFKAFTTDTFMVMMPLMYIVFYIVLGSREEFAKNMLLGWSYILIPHFVIMIFFWYKKQQTPGLKAYELAIVNSSTCKEASLTALINRYIWTSLSMMFILPLFIPYFRKDKKTLQDIISNTCIINKPNQTTTPKK